MITTLATLREMIKLPNITIRKRIKYLSDNNKIALYETINLLKNLK